MITQNARHGHVERDLDAQLKRIAETLVERLEVAIEDDTIEKCGPAPLAILRTHPDVVLELASGKMHLWPYHQVPICWRRLYEDASIWKAVQLLRLSSDNGDRFELGKRKRADSNPENAVDSFETDSIARVVRTLDMGIHMSGAPTRSKVFEEAFEQFDRVLQKTEDMDNLSSPFVTRKPSVPGIENPIARTSAPLDLEQFQNHIDRSATPLLIPDALDFWPAMQRWQDPSYLLRKTLGGRRLVPVEVGKAYTDNDWSQTLITFKEFLTRYMLPSQPENIGYLAQHDLFAQIPALKSDITVPDYCYTSPPQSVSTATAKTAGLSTTPPLDEPLLNAWFGPAGTKTPLHTDPYHNILCQVVGYKYVRLYAPEETPRLYARAVDEKGINMENTSSVDVGAARVGEAGSEERMKGMRDLEDFPLFEKAGFVEGILGPGECLYVPLGWWHYVEGLSASFSVSFWWN